MAEQPQTFGKIPVGGLTSIGVLLNPSSFRADRVTTISASPISSGYSYSQRSESVRPPTTIISERSDSLPVSVSGNVESVDSVIQRISSMLGEPSMQLNYSAGLPAGGLDFSGIEAFASSLGLIGVDAPMRISYSSGTADYYGSLGLMLDDQVSRSLFNQLPWGDVPGGDSSSVTDILSSLSALS